MATERDDAFERKHDDSDIQSSASSLLIEEAFKPVTGSDKSTKPDSAQKPGGSDASHLPVVTLDNGGGKRPNNTSSSPESGDGLGTSPSVKPGKEPAKEVHGQPSPPSTGDGQGILPSVRPLKERQGHPSPPSTGDGQGNVPSVRPLKERQEHPSPPSTGDGQGKLPSVRPLKEGQGHPSPPSTSDGQGNLPSVKPLKEVQGHPSPPSTSDAQSHGSAGKEHPSRPTDEKHKLPAEVTAVVSNNIGRYDTIAVDLDQIASAIKNKLEQMGEAVSNPNIPDIPGLSTSGILDYFFPPKQNEGAVVILEKGDKVLAESTEKQEHRTEPEKIDSEREKEDPELKNQFKDKKEASREQLLKRLEESGLSKEGLDKIKENLKTLEERSKTEFDDHIPDRELAKFYDDINHLLEGKDNAKLPQLNREVLAEQLIAQSAHPEDISQGYHNTCNVTTVENVLYSRNPSAVSGVVTEAALSGQFKTQDGTVINLSRSNLRPDAEARNVPPIDGQRSYASQIFQESAANIFWQRQDKTPQGAKVEKGSMHYETGAKDPTMKKDTGERLLAADGKPLKNRDGKTANSPMLDFGQMQDVYQQITGKTPVALMVDYRPQNTDKKGVIAPETPEQMHEFLKELKEGSKYGRLPIIIRVPEHVLVIRDYDPHTGKVTVDNSWNRGFDYLGKPGTLEQQHIREVFKDMWTWKQPTPAS